MLVIAPSRIPPEGMDLQVDLSPGELHLEAEEGFDFEGGSLRGTLEKGDDQSVHVRGRLEARLGLRCGRCLEPFALAVDEEIDLFSLPHRPNEVEEEEAVELQDRDVVVAYYQGDRLDLAGIVREQLFLAVPMKRLCGEGCKGLCPSCGCNLNRDQCACKQEDTDPRLAPLRQIFEKSRQGRS